MPKDRDELNKGEFSLEDILAEFRTTAGPAEEKPAAAGEKKPAPPRRSAAPAGAKKPDETAPTRERPDRSSPPRSGGNVVSFPPRGGEKSPAGASRPDRSAPRPEGSTRKAPEEKKEKVLDFPGSEEKGRPKADATAEERLRSGLDALRRKADDYAEHMFEAEGVEDDQDVRRAEKYLPGVDEEETPSEPAAPKRPRRRRLPPAPDYAPGDLYRRYNHGLSFLRLRTILVLLLALPPLYVTLSPFFSLTLPGPLGASYELQVYALAVMLVAALLLGGDVFLAGLLHIPHLGIGMDTLVSLSCIAALVDALTMLHLSPRTGQMPYCAIAVLALGLTMRGTYLKRLGCRSACRTAAAAQEPYLVTLDEGKWNGRGAYTKWSGESAGFGSQIQAPDGAQRIFRITAPLLLIGCVLLSMVASLGQKAPGRFFWCLSATLTASASFSGALCFAVPWNRLCRRLSKVGAAVAGWDGVAEGRGSAGIVLTDTDLFPPGSVSMNGIKIFGNFPVEKVVGCAATLVRQSGCGLEKVFHDLLRSQGASYRSCDQFACYEGGISAVIRGDQVLVGSAAFMHLMEISMPQGLNVKNAVFCAINGDLAGIFALNYNLHGAVRPALTALIHDRIGPVLATRDFNLIPAMLRQRFKLPVEKMEFPAVERRRELSQSDQEHSEVLCAVLCREGLGPFSEAVVGSRRLRSAVRRSALLASLGSVIGMLLAFYLTSVGSFTSASPANMLIFLLLWLVPTLIISGWVDRY